MSIQVRQEISLQFLLACKVSLANLFKKMLTTVSFIFVGRLGKHYLSAAGLASVTANVFGNSILVGMGGALSTLCSQAQGAHDLEAANLSLQRALIVMILFCVPISLLWTFSAPVMIILGQSESIAVAASHYLIALIPGLFMYSWTICIQQWLYAQQKALAVTIIAASVAAIHPLLCYVLTQYSPMKFVGVALAISLSRTVELVLLVLYVSFGGVCEEMQFYFSWNSWYGWGPYLRLMVPNILMMSEWWADEVIIFISGTLGNPDLDMAAMSIYQNLNVFCFLLPLGYQIAAVTRVGYYIGSNEVGMAVIAAQVSSALGISFSSVAAVVLFCYGATISTVFTSDAEVIDLVSQLMTPLSTYVIADGLQTTLSGIVNGLSKQRIAGPIVFVCYYIIAIPLALVLGTDRGLGLGVKGLCWATVIGTYVHAGLYTVLLSCTTWGESVPLASVQNVVSSIDTSVSDNDMMDRNITNRTSNQFVRYSLSRVQDMWATSLPNRKIYELLEYKSSPSEDCS